MTGDRVDGGTGSREEENPAENVRKSGRQTPGWYDWGTEYGKMRGRKDRIP